jgi:hypothetical protein
MQCWLDMLLTRVSQSVVIGAVAEQQNTQALQRRSVALQQRIKRSSVVVFQSIAHFCYFNAMFDCVL